LVWSIRRISPVIRSRRFGLEGFKVRRAGVASQVAEALTTVSIRITRPSLRHFFDGAL
jgi:hypothetical protein